MWNYMAQGMYPYDMLSLGLGMMFVLFIIGIAVYVFSSLALMTIAQKFNHPRPWLAWIPLADIALILQLGKFHWAWTFLILIPFLGWIVLLMMFIVSEWHIFEARKYPGWLSINWLATIAYVIILGHVAWKDQPGKKSASKPAVKKTKAKKKK